MPQFLCGCAYGTKDDAFFFNPCSETCSNYAMVVDEIRKRGKPVAALDLGGQGYFDEAVCPFCGKPNDGLTSDNRANRPSPGDLSICAYCCEVGIFTEAGIRRPTKEERASFENNEELKALRDSARLLWG